MKTFYIHTLNGIPATFDGYQICYSIYFGKPNIAVKSLAQIKREQKISIANREADGYDNKAKFGHLRYASP